MAIKSLKIYSIKKSISKLVLKKNSSLSDHNKPEINNKGKMQIAFNECLGLVRHYMSTGDKRYYFPFHHSFNKFECLLCARDPVVRKSPCLQGSEFSEGDNKYSYL